MSKRKPLPYQEGTFFAVPLRTSGYGVGIVARLSGTGIIFGYFFGPKYISIPQPDQMTSFTPDVSILAIQFGDLGILRAEWPIVVHSASFDRLHWPLPPFIRVDEVAGVTYKETYSDDLVLMDVQLCEARLVDEYPKAVLSGYGAIEKRLTRLLD